jgi:predicted nucleic acid-binding Zn finger protein
MLDYRKKGEIKLISDLEKLQRIRDISDKDVQQEDSFTFFITSQSDKNKEVIWMVYFPNHSYKQARCTCPDFMYRNNEETPDYECKHIGKVRDMLLRRLNK